MLQDQRRLRRTTTLVTIYMGSLLALAATATPVASAGDQAMRFGMDINAIDAQTNADIAPDLAMFWIGPWTLEHGWGGPDTWLDNAASKGVTPVIQFYYWGDDISTSCIENGCWSDLHGAWKDKAGWQDLAKQLANHLNARLAGKPAVIVLETEFNKNGVTTYEPLDAYLESKANYFHANYPAAEVVLGLGNWGRADWHTWDRAAAASDAIGLQGLRGSTRDSLSSYLGLFDATLAGAKKAQSLFGKPVFLSDIALSTYPEPEYTNHQATVLQAFFDRLDELEAAGVNALVYRALKDDPTFNTNNYYGEAERHWGLRRADGTNKPAWVIWRDGVEAARAGSASTTATDGPIEAESFQTKTAGGVEGDTSASGGQRWNLWSNGHVAHSISFGSAGTYGLTVTAKGTEAAGVAPHMVVQLDGATVLTADPPAGPWQSYAVSLDVATAGTRTLKIVFTNDAWIDGADRNLLLDKVELAPIVNTPPEASFTASASELAASVDASTSTDADGDALTYAWSWGDGSTGAGQTASHTYAAEGTYTITLTVSDGQDTASTTRSLTVTAPAPTGAPVASDGPTRMEVESFETRSTGGLHVDGAASEGKAWNLWANGHVAQLLSFDEPGTYELTVHAKGDELGGVAPHMLVRFDGATVLEADPPQGGYEAYTTTVDVPAAGTYELRIAFTNDAASATEDRNLILDRVELAPHTPDPILALDASPFKRQGIHHVRLVWSGATTTAVDVHVDGAWFSTTPNDGRQSYSLGTRGQGTHTLRVCEAGTSVCSAEVTVTY